MNISVLVWLFVLHGVAIYLFLSGFLLSRLALPDVSPPLQDSTRTLVQTHKRAIVIVLDALRYDFFAPLGDAIPRPYDPYYHGVLSTPARMAAERPDRSMVFSAHADPPTTTLQRIKALTTGSLPTFVDAGANFGGDAVGEDSWVLQAKKAGKKLAFVGDNTWLALFPDAFDPLLTWGYDSFDVEDLHTVDDAVFTRVPFLLNLTSTDSDDVPWDILLAHGLGIDHAGHRFSPSHEGMQAKLSQTDLFLSNLVDLLDSSPSHEDTLLVVLGDHGMDEHGNHGGDTALETIAGTWIYSPSPFIASLSDEGNIPEQMHEETFFPGAFAPHRHVQQVDLVPSLSLLLGLPVPFGSLGAPIPELFALRTHTSVGAGSALAVASALSAAQIHMFLDKAGMSELDSLTEVWNPRVGGLAAHLHPAAFPGKTYATALSANEELDVSLAVGSRHISRALAKDAHAYSRGALKAARARWAQFDGPLMIVGLASTSLAVIAAGALFWRLGLPSPVALPVGPKTAAVASTEVAEEAGRELVDTATWLKNSVRRAWQAMGAGVVLGVQIWGAFKIIGRIDYFEVLAITLGNESPTRMGVLHFGALGAACAGSASMLASCFSGSGAVGPRKRIEEQETKRTLSQRFSSLLSSLTIEATVPVALITLHSIALFSNSFVIHESLLIPFFLISAPLPFLLRTIPSARRDLRRKSLLWAGVYAVCVRLMGAGRVWREEQGVFFGLGPHSATSSEVTIVEVLLNTVPSWVSRMLNATAPLATGPILSYALRTSRSRVPLIVRITLPISLSLASLAWFLEDSTASADAGSAIEGVARVVRTLCAWTSAVLSASGIAAWATQPLCISVSHEAPAEGNKVREKQTITVLGFANASGAPILVFQALLLAPLALCALLPSQRLAPLLLGALTGWFELTDAARDARTLDANPIGAANTFTSAIPETHTHTSSPSTQSVPAVPTLPASMTQATLAELMPLALLGLHAFFGTAHQATIASIQWRSAFVLSARVRPGLSHLCVAINELGPVIWASAGAVGLAVWNVSPRIQIKVPRSALNHETRSLGTHKQEDTTPTEEGTVPVHSGGQNEDSAEVLRAALGPLIYFSVLFLAGASGAAVLRRHLMVWKIYAPRAVAGALWLIAADIGALLGAWSARRVTREVTRVFG